MKLTYVDSGSGVAWDDPGSTLDLEQGVEREEKEPNFWHIFSEVSPILVSGAYSLASVYKIVV